MKRDPRLHGLSSDHHQALVLARRIEAGALDVAQTRRSFDAELVPHFAVEEEILLPALRAAGRADLADRTKADHEAIRDALVRAERGEPNALSELASLVTRHVRFEERELFPCCETTLPASVLDAVHARRPHS